MSHSLVITIYNAPSDVQLCLDSMEKSLDLNEVELVLVDDCSASQTAEIIDGFVEKNPGVKLVRHEENKGYLQSVNDGIEACSHDIITLLNSDTYIPKDFSPRILACFAHDEKIGIASPVLTHGNPFSVPLSFDKLDPGKENSSLLIAEKVAEKNAQAKKISCLYPDIVFPDGACFSVRRECFEKAGLFAKAYAPGYFEELDFCMRVLRLGYRAVFIENLYVYHKSHASFGKKKTSLYMKRNKKLFHDTWGAEYEELAGKNPKKKHKKRVFCAFYSMWHYCFVETLLKISRIIPISSVRRKIRALYQ